MNTSLWKILFGNIGMFLCSMFYLTWWTIAFKPGGTATSLSTLSLVLAFITGVGGIVLACFGITFLSYKTHFSQWWILSFAFFIYVILLFATSKILHRRVTSELAIIFIWASFECCIINVLHGYYRWPGLSIVLMLIVVAAIIASMFFYVRYYTLPPEKSYIEGMLPLIIDGGVTLFVILSMLLLKKSEALAATTVVN